MKTGAAGSPVGGSTTAQVAVSVSTGSQLEPSRGVSAFMQSGSVPTAQQWQSDPSSYHCGSQPHVTHEVPTQT
jgi:hypothetical protein